MEEETSFPRGAHKTSIDKKTRSSKNEESEKLLNSRKEKRKRTQSDDFLFGTKGTHEEKTKKTKTSSTLLKRSAPPAPSLRSQSETFTSGALSISSSVLPIGGGAVLQPTTGASSKAALIESVSFQKLSKNTKLLGIIREVKSDYALVSLPNMLTGYIRRDEKTKLGLDQIIQVGMVLSVVVLKASSETVSQKSSTNHRSKNKAQVVKKRIELSISPSHVNDGWTVDTLYETMTIRGRIKSIEDHGCIVDVSVPGVGGNSCFLKFENIEGSYSFVSDDEDLNENEKDDKEEEDCAIHDSAKESVQRSERLSSSVIINKGRIYDFTVLSIPSKFDKTSSTSIIQLSLETNSTRSKRITESVNQGLKSSSFTLRSLNPGMLVSASIEHHARNGLCVSFFGLFRGSIEMGHLGGYYSDQLSSLMQRLGKESSNDKKEMMWWKEVFPGKLSIAARIIVIDPMAKIIRLSLLPHILKFEAPSTICQPIVGTVYEGARVIRLDPGIGALIALPNATEVGDDVSKSQNHDAKEKSAIGKNSKLVSNPIYKLASTVQCTYLHISKSSEGDDGSLRMPELSFNKRFALCSMIPKLRILSNANWLDNISSCGTAESILNSVALNYGDLKPGAIYKSVPIVANFKGGSMLVQLGTAGINGIVPSHHLFDHAENISSTGKSITSRSKLRMEKFKVGNKIDVRCLCVDSVKGKCTLSAKPSLLTNDIDDPIINYSSIEISRLATGYISKVSEHGLNVTFYNNVFGSVSARRLAEEKGIEDPRSDYNFGDVIKVRVLKCLESKKTSEAYEGHRTSFLLDLSLNLDPGDIFPSETDEDRSNCILRSGSILPANVIKVVELCDSLTKSGCDEIIPGHAIVSVRTKDVQALLSETGKKKAFYCKVPYEHLQDIVSPEIFSSKDTLNAFARQHLPVGRTIQKESIVLSYDNTENMNILSFKSQLIQTSRNSSSENAEIILPSSSSSLYMGVYVNGYCSRIDPRYGAFIRFLDNLSGLIPKVKGGLDICLYNSVLCRVLAIDVEAGKTPKILLKEASLSKGKKIQDDMMIAPPLSINVGDIVGDVRINDMNFARAAVSLLNPKFSQCLVKARIHVTMADPLVKVKEIQMPLTRAKKDDIPSEETSELKITKYHPFYTWKEGCVIRNVQCVFVSIRDGVTYLELTNRSIDERPKSGNELSSLSPSHLFVDSSIDLKPGLKVSCIITNISKTNRGIWVQICPGVTGFIPGFDVCDDVKILNALSKYFKIGGRTNCWVVSHIVDSSNKTVRLSAREYNPIDDGSASDKRHRPAPGALIIGRINRLAYIQRPPALMLELQGGVTGRCDITELKDYDEWSNMPLGRMLEDENMKSTRLGTEIKENESMLPSSCDEDLSSGDEQPNSEYFHGRYVRCRILPSSASSSFVVDVSLRASRLDGNLEDDKIPEVNDLAQAYVVSTTKKGCFVRLSRFVEGRVLLKNLSDSFIHDPVSMFPAGRLVVGRIQTVRNMDSNSHKRLGVVIKQEVDLNMRESVILEDKNKMTWDDLKEGHKYSGIVTRVESFGVFVRLENSDVSGLAHLSECSDDYIKSLNALYDPGDLVKALVIKIDPDLKRVALSLKASHFEGDDAMSDSCEEYVESEEDDESMISTNDNELEHEHEESDDENYIDRLKEQIRGESQETDTDGSNNEDIDDSSETSEDSAGKNAAMDTNVGFDWGNMGSKSSKNGDFSASEDDYDDSHSETDSDESSTSIKSRKKGSGKFQEEKEISSKELRIASGMADESPETISDFERLLASHPDSSENWIRYMAFHLSLSDIDSARHVANRAIERIEFRSEGERLNIWTALLTLELKYGTLDTFQNTIERAAQQNNPKQVYLRVCELLARESDEIRNNHNTGSRESFPILSLTDELFSKMTKKFKTKKTVWIAYCKYLLKEGRHEEAHNVSKRAMSSLPSYKHIETMSKFAQLEYELGSHERAKTVFEALVDKYPKRLDLFFVFVDKEVKYSGMDSVRKLFERTMSHHSSNHKVRYSDKQMKSLFKKWFKLEESHGNEKTRQHVKNEAKQYVENSMKTDE